MTNIPTAEEFIDSKFAKNVKETLGQIIKELNEEKVKSIGSPRGGDYRIGLDKAMSIVYDKIILL